MIDLKDTTFIIAIRIESEDRKQNALLTLNYLCNHLMTNIIILEHDESPKMPEILDSIIKNNTKIDYHFFKAEPGEIFHRTKFLNIMLNIVTTPVVVNYDIDILLSPETYRKCRDLIKNNYELVYPYFFGISQYRINYSGREKLLNTFNLNSLSIEDSIMWQSEYGHCQFFNTKSYKIGGMENENFISYAPEDQERGYRFKKLEYKVLWSTDYVYHIEHTRGINSSDSNPFYKSNNELFDFIKTLSKEELIKYYSNIEYLKKYK